MYGMYEETPERKKAHEELDIARNGVFVKFDSDIPVALKTISAVVGKIDRLLDDPDLKKANELYGCMYRSFGSDSWMKAPLFIHLDVIIIGLKYIRTKQTIN